MALSTWGLLQVVFNIFAALGLFVVIMRMNRAPKDDPRLSRGLQLLQSKISVLEDLSDRTESQVTQMTAIIDQKCREVQAKVQLAEQHVNAIRVSMDRSLEVAKIFQDKIPHQEIIERQNTMKYVQAARLAHQGLSAEEIAAKVELPKGEIEFIAKVNRDQLVFNEQQLPWWAKDGEAGAEVAATTPTAESEAEAFARSLANFAASNGQANGQANGQTNGQTNSAPIEAAPAVAAPVVDADQSNRLRAQMELAEQQSLVDNLSRLQFEMQNLDIQLARENHGRDLTTAFEAPRVESTSLAKLGEEFRKACDAAAQQEARAGFAPLEHLANLIPQSFIGGGEEETQASVSPMYSQPAAGPQAPAPAPIDMRDPAQIRADAIAKVQAALQRGNQASAAATAAPTHEALAAAREFARQHAPTEQETAPAPQRTAQPAPQRNAQPIANRSSTTSKDSGVVKTVVFPRIDRPQER